MIRFATYLIILIISITFSFAQIKSEEILIKNDKIELPGTLTYTKEKTPLLIWVHGSGNVDRNGNQAPMINANYIKQFRDSVNTKGIAFFSYDKRSANKKNIPILMAGVSFEDFVFDLKTVINHFKKSNRFSKIITIGHSQGSLVAMLALENVDKYISLAGPSTTFDKAVIKQIEKQAPDLKETVIDYFKELQETQKIKDVNPKLMNLFAPMNQKFLYSWMQYNPSEEIKKITKPILIINGDKDIQVSVNEAKALHKANPKSELRIIKNMNHVIKHVNSPTENQQSYFSKDFPLAKQLISEIVTFSKQ